MCQCVKDIVWRNFSRSFILEIFRSNWITCLPNQWVKISTGWQEIEVGTCKFIPPTWTLRTSKGPFCFAWENRISWIWQPSAFLCTCYHKPTQMELYDVFRSCQTLPIQIVKYIGTTGNFWYCEVIFFSNCSIISI